MSPLEKRIRSIDTIRGISMAWMIFAHLLDWWTSSEFHWLVSMFHSVFEPLGASCFLFISGISISISYRKRMKKAKNSENYFLKEANLEYFFRAILIFLVAFGYNVSVAIMNFDLSWLWSWFILLTIAISVFVAFPLLKTPIYVRLIISIGIWIINFFIIDYLKNQNGFLGIIFHLFYNPLDLVPFPYFFPFFLIGTVIGDYLSDYLSSPNEVQRYRDNSVKLLFLSLIIGITCFSATFIMFQQEFLIRRTTAWLLYSTGLHFSLFSILFFLADVKFKDLRKRRRFFYFYSYYSLTIFLVHNILYFLLLDQLSGVWGVLISLSGVFIIGWILNRVHEVLGPKISLKYQISSLSKSLAQEIMNKKTI